MQPGLARCKFKVIDAGRRGPQDDLLVSWSSTEGVAKIHARDRRYGRAADSSAPDRVVCLEVGGGGEERTKNK